MALHEKQVSSLVVADELAITTILSFLMLAARRGDPAAGNRHFCATPGTNGNVM